MFIFNKRKLENRILETKKNERIIKRGHTDFKILFFFFIELG